MPTRCVPAAAILLAAALILLTIQVSGVKEKSAAVEWCDANCVDASDAGEPAAHRNITPPSAKFTLIVGCQKCGTTFLHGWLSRHPSVAPASKNAGKSRIKELHYLDRPVGAELSHSVYMSYWGHATEDVQTSDKYMFEASPAYVLNPCAACR